MAPIQVLSLKGPWPFCGCPAGVCAQTPVRRRGLASAHLPTRPGGADCCRWALLTPVSSLAGPGEALPEGFQRSEFLLEHGMLDRIVPRAEMRDELALILENLGRTPR